MDVAGVLGAYKEGMEMIQSQSQEIIISRRQAKAKT
jgi:hypothetical protein